MSRVVQSNDFIDVLENKEAITFISKHIGQDTSLLSLKKGLSDKPNFTVWLQLIKIYTKAQKKLPTFFAHFLALDQRSYEQATSEQVARYKSNFIYGDTLLDITGGLGVDSMFLAAGFNSIVAVEQNKELHSMASYNVAKLGISNLIRKEGDGTSFLKKNYDWVYVDPDRRPGTGRSVALHLLQPDVLKILPLLQKWANRAYIKLSPLFDLDELRRQFMCIESIHVIAQSGEVKEVGVVLNFSLAASQNRIRLRDVSTDFDVELVNVPNLECENIKLDEVYKYVLLPNSLLAKTKSIGYFLSNTEARKNQFFDIFYSNEIPEVGFRTFLFLESTTLNTKSIKRILKKYACTRVNIAVKGLSDKPEVWHKKLGTKDGGEYYLLILKSKKSEAVLTKIFSEQ